MGAERVVSVNMPFPGSEMALGIEAGGVDW